MAGSDGKLEIERWKEKATAQAQVKTEIVKHLFANLPDGVYDADEIDLKAPAVSITDRDVDVPVDGPFTALGTTIRGSRRDGATDGATLVARIS